MGRTLVQILPLALAATVSPTGLLFVMMILSGKNNPNPKRSALFFVIGAIVFLIALGLLVNLTFTPAVETTSKPGRTSGVIDVLFGLLVIGIVTRSVLMKKKEKLAKKKISKKPYIVLGFSFMIINISTLIPFIAANKIIAVDGLALVDNVILFAIVIVIAMLLVAFPVIVTYLMPKKSAVILGPVTGFMQRHGDMIAHIFFFVIGLYLIAHGIVGMLNQ